MIVKNLNDNQMKPGIFAKYYWLMEYWNKFLNDEHLSIPIDGDMSESECQEEWERYMKLKIDPDVIPYV